MVLSELLNYTQAIAYFDKALAIDPKNINALVSKGSTLLLLCDDKQTVTYFDRALAIDPKNPEALAGKGTVKERTNNPFSMNLCKSTLKRSTI